MDGLAQKKQVIKEAAFAAGGFIKTANPTKGIINKEGRCNFVTAADLASEKMIIDLIKTHFPNDEILSEETNNDLKNILEKDALWIIDPIDGTNNFAHQRNYSCVSIGYAEKGIIKLGAIYNPFAEEVFFAEKGKGAFVNDVKISIGDGKNLNESVIGTDNSYYPEVGKKHLQLLLSLQPTAFTLMKGSAALLLCEIASGRTDLYFHTDINAWDTAAGILLIEEAGGVVKNLQGKIVTYDSREIVVGNKTLVDQFITMVTPFLQQNPAK